MLNLRPVVVGYVPGAYIRPVDDQQTPSAPVKMSTKHKQSWTGAEYAEAITRLNRQQQGRNRYIDIGHAEVLREIQRHKAISNATNP